MESRYHRHKNVFPTNICTLLYSLVPSTYDEIAPKIEFWIEYGLAERFTTTEDLVEQVSSVAWNISSASSDVPRFLKEFRDAPHRSDLARSFVDELCLRILRWFAAASADDGLQMGIDYDRIPEGGGTGFVRAASFVCRLIEYGLLSSELVRRHLVKPLIHHNQNGSGVNPVVRASVIYQLFATAGNTLLQGLLEPKDVQACFEILDGTSGVVGMDAARLNELREIHATWLQRELEEDERRNATAAEVPTGEVDTPLAFIPQDLPSTHIDVDPPSSTLRSIVSPSILQDMEYPPETFVDISSTAVSSPTLSISTVSDLTPTELGEDIEDGDGERVTTPHDTFYFEDGNVEVVCGHILFRVHSTTVSFSSPKLREMLSRSVLLHAPTPDGCPRITIEDSSQDFAVLLKMIYTPGFPAWRKVPEFTVFASLLRMTTKYGFSDVREQLLDSIKSAYPTRWEAGPAQLLGEDIFGSPKPHPNTVLNLFTEQGIKFALPFAAYRAGLGGFSSLTSNKPGTALPRLALASTICGMETVRGGLAKLAHSVVCNMSLEVCRDGACAVNSIGPTERRMEALNQIYDAMVKEGKGDVLSSNLSLSWRRIVCMNCVNKPAKAYHLWRAAIWEELPRIFGVGKSWEEVES